MKFAEKIIWSCLLTIAIVFCLGSTIMIMQNHNHLLQTIIQQNITTHEIEIYSLESKAFQDTINFSTQNENKLMERLVYYIEQFETSLNQRQGSYAISDSQDRIIYSHINTDLKSYITNKQDQKYRLVYLNKHQYMMMTGKFKVGNQTYYLTGCYDISSCFEERNRQFLSFIMIGTLILVISFFILRILSRYLTQSILKLNEASQHIAAGNYSERTQIQTSDEIGELSKSFDEMAAANEQRIHELQQNLDQREEFMGSFSHEIKTPMTAILGFADMLCTMDCDEKTRRKAAHYIYTEGKRLENLSYTLMELLSLGEREIQLEIISLETIIKQLKNYYEGKGIHHQLVFDMPSCFVYAHGDLLFTLLRNLIDNALKASDDNQNVLIYTKQVDQQLTIFVQDHGVGMSEEDIEKATEPFYMADKSRSRAQGGAGLGLSIVKRICDVHHTTLLIQSQLGVGTTVSFELEVLDHE